MAGVVPPGEHLLRLIRSAVETNDLELLGATLARERAEAEARARKKIQQEVLYTQGIDIENQDMLYLPSTPDALAKVKKIESLTEDSSDLIDAINTVARSLSSKGRYDLAEIKEIASKERTQLGHSSIAVDELSEAVEIVRQILSGKLDLEEWLEARND